MSFAFGPRRSAYIDIGAEPRLDHGPLAPSEVEHFEAFDLIYRSLCALMFNYVPMSGHPGGSISSGRVVAGAVFDAMEYDLRDPDRDDADILCYAAGHKALGLYALSALRTEVARMAAPDLLPADEAKQLRLEDLLGFRRNPATRTPLFRQFRSKPLDGHPTPATPFVRLATGASGVGVASSIGLALGARDAFGSDAPRVHIVEGEGGLTPGRVAEAMAAAGTARLDNIVMHLDWNQASIDTDHVCRDGEAPGHYVQWTPAELAYLNDWNVVFVPDGLDVQQVIAAQRRAAALDTGQPTMIVYRTVKGWQYGLEGRASHGAGHKLCSQAFYAAVRPFTEPMSLTLPECGNGAQRCADAGGDEVMEACYWEALQLVRRSMEEHPAMVGWLADRLRAAGRRLDDRHREPRRTRASVARVFDVARRHQSGTPSELALAPGTVTTLRAELGRALGFLNRESGGALIAASADLMGSTSLNLVGEGFPGGFYEAVANPDARLIALGGICEDAMTGVLGGLSTFGRHLGVGSSYAAFIAALGHVPARLHAIGAQARHAAFGEAYPTMVLVCAHAGIKTGEDGPTHADPQALQLLQENFPSGTAITLTPWDPCEVWPLLAAALARRPAVIAPYVTRPNETVPDRAALGLAAAQETVHGVYRLRGAQESDAGVVVLQGSGVTYEFVRVALPLLDAAGIDLNVYYVSSAELFDAQSARDQSLLFPQAHRERAMGITGFTLPTMFRWVTSEAGRSATLHPFRKGHYLGSGQADKVLLEAGLDGESQYRAVLAHVGRLVAVA